MTTAVPTNHRFTHPTAMFAAAAAAVILGGAAAVGFAVSLDSTDAPTGSGTTTSTHYQGCTDPRCLPPVQHHHGNQFSGSNALEGGGHVVGTP